LDPLILSVDLGTTSIKLAIIDNHGHIVATAMREYVLKTEQASYVECSEDTYWDAFTGGLAELLETIGNRKASIKALGISAQGETLFFLDEKGKSLRDAIVWMDNRAEKESSELREKFTDEVCYKTTGQVQFDPCWPAAKVLWVKKNQPEVFKKTKTFALIEDWFIYRLTGHMVTEGSLITSTVYWNLITKKWWPEMLAFLGISEDRLPKIMEPGEKVGAILPSIAEALDLPKDMVICTGALDQAAAAIGIGNICEGRFSENIGAALAICAPVSKPLFDPNRKMPLHYFGIPNMYMLHTFTTGGMAIKWFRDSFCEMEKSVAELTGKSAYMLMDDEAALVPAGSDGLVALPHLSGSMAPDVNARAKGVFFGFTMKHGKPHFIRAIMESVGYIIRRNIEALENAGLRVSELRSSGGGSKSPLWNQIKADIIGKPLVTIKCSEAACLGAAILAGTAIGMFDSVEKACQSMAEEKARFIPNAENRSAYNTGYEDYKRLFADLNGLFDVTYRQ
jgi:sugar (pentulose or hexulose) kinase